MALVLIVHLNPNQSPIYIQTAKSKPRWNDLFHNDQFDITEPDFSGVALYDSPEWLRDLAIHSKSLVIHLEITLFIAIP